MSKSTTYLLVLDGDRLVGGLAVSVRRRFGVRRLTAPGPTVLCPDHLDLIAEPGAEAEVAAAVGAWFRGPGQRVLDLRGVDDDSLIARAVGVAAAPMDVAPYQSLPAAPDTYLAGRSSNFRRSVRRATRSLAALGIEHRRVEAADLPGAFDAFRSLHAGREGRGPLVAELPTLERALVAGVAAGEARVDVLASNDQVVAVCFAFVLGGRLSLYQVARSLEREHDGAGNVLLVAVIEDAVAAGCHEVDLLRGGEGYKSSFADATRPIGRLRAAHGGVARVLLAGEDAARRLNARLRSRVP
ncbi:GNAT family N-acetyltransferase [Nocardioides conyzicola]|uniref:GNAT family N-acetyltransferase n=1 Tax=Nocardioides conyzicola TaxID=1651781 RepID=UPI0031E66748